MGAEVLEFVSAHGTVVVLATTLLTAIGIVQWRKARAAELDLAFMEDLLAQGLPVAEIVVLLRAKDAVRTGPEELLEQGLSAAEIEMLLHAKAATCPGLLQQFGDLSGGAKLLLVVALTITAIMTLGVIGSSVSDLAR